jgi:hypothetical protein
MYFRGCIQFQTTRHFGSMKAKKVLNLVPPTRGLVLSSDLICADAINKLAYEVANYGVHGVPKAIAIVNDGSMFDAWRIIVGKIKIANSEDCYNRYDRSKLLWPL